MLLAPGSYIPLTGDCVSYVNELVTTVPTLRAWSSTRVSTLYILLLAHVGVSMPVTYQLPLAEPAVIPVVLYQAVSLFASLMLNVFALLSHQSLVPAGSSWILNVTLSRFDL